METDSSKRAISDSGSRTEFSTGAVRDIQEGKGRFDLLPLDVIYKIFEGCEKDEDKEMGEFFKNIFAFKHAGLAYQALVDAIKCFRFELGWSNSKMLMELAKHFEEGAKKYGEYNWQKGIPISRYIDSAIRHYCKWHDGWDDEPHDRAVLWNLICCLWTCENKPEMDDFTVKAKKDE